MFLEPDCCAFTCLAFIAMLFILCLKDFLRRKKKEIDSSDEVV